jgi:N-acetylmuramoyl-L-alanine amidase
MSAFTLGCFTSGCSHHADHDTDSLLSRAADLLDAISRNPRNAIPTAVLNQGNCLVVIPVLRPGEVEAGVASCRKTPEQWNQPFLVHFAGRLAQAEISNLVIVVLTDSGVRKLQSAKLPIGQRTPAPMVATTPVTTQVDLHSETLSYEQTGDLLSGTPVRGTVVRAETDQQKFAKKSVEKFLSSVISLFNSIMPSGIVIHHTAVLPTDNALPKNRREVDTFHQARGFEIMCQGRIYHIAYHYLILPNGKVQPGRPERCQGAHALGYNSYLGISVVGDFSPRDDHAGNIEPRAPTQQQIEAVVRLCRQLRDRYNIPLQHIVRHNDISSTDCPGSRFPFQYVLQQIAQQPSQATPRA